jgi:hypothetical protein
MEILFLFKGEKKMTTKGIVVCIMILIVFFIGISFFCG